MSASKKKGTVKLSASAWGLYTLAPHGKASKSAAVAMNRRATDLLRAEQAERLNRRELIRIGHILYREFGGKYGDLGAGDTEGRYGVESAISSYLQQHGIDSTEMNLSGDFLLWE